MHICQQVEIQHQQAHDTLDRNLGDALEVAQDQPQANDHEGKGENVHAPAESRFQQRNPASGRPALPCETAGSAGWGSRPPGTGTSRSGPACGQGTCRFGEVTAGCGPGRWCSLRATLPRQCAAGWLRGHRGLAAGDEARVAHLFENFTHLARTATRGALPHRRGEAEPLSSSAGASGARFPPGGGAPPGRRPVAGGLGVLARH